MTSLGGMGGERGLGAERESSPFAVTVEDYRRAFALGIESWPVRIPPFRDLVLARWLGGWKYGSAVGAVGGVLWGLWFVYRYGGDFWEAMWEAVTIGGGVALAMVPAALLLALWQARDIGQWRKRFPRERAAWKRPQRMRIRWNEAGLTLAGQEGFGNFAWRMLHAWVEAGGVLVIFTAPLDPLPIPHEALSAEDLENLRARLAGAEVPRAWSPMSDDAQRLKHVFG